MNNEETPGLGVATRRGGGAGFHGLKSMATVGKSLRDCQWPHRPGAYHFWPRAPHLVPRADPGQSALFRANPGNKKNKANSNRLV